MQTDWIMKNGELKLGEQILVADELFISIIKPKKTRRIDRFHCKSS